jgi:hypothetical protein
MLPDAQLDPKLAFEIGWDAARLRRTLWDGTHPLVRAGFDASCAHFGRNRVTHEPDIFELKHLQLQHSAWKRGIYFDPTLTAAHLSEMCIYRCPITRKQMTSGLVAPTDWSVDRVNNAIGYTRRNIVVMSAEANVAKGALTAFDLADILKSGRTDQIPNCTLDFASLMRLAVMTAVATTDAPLDTPLIHIPNPYSWVRNADYLRKVVAFVIALDGSADTINRWAAAAPKAKRFRHAFLDFADCLYHAMRRTGERVSFKTGEVPQLVAIQIEESACEPLVERYYQKLVETGFRALRHSALDITVHTGKSGIDMYSIRKY